MDTSRDKNLRLLWTEKRQKHGSEYSEHWLKDVHDEVWKQPCSSVLYFINSWWHQATYYYFSTWHIKYKCACTTTRRILKEISLSLD